MAEKIVRDAEKKTAGAAGRASKPAEKAAETAKKAAPAKKPQQTIVTPNKPTGGSTIGLRIGAVALWILAIVCEVFAIMATRFYKPEEIYKKPDSELEKLMAQRINQ